MTMSAAASSAYSTDERWLIPHFEKMLYDNALLVDILTQIWQFNRNRACAAKRVIDTVAWMLRDMRVGGGFASGLDADSDGEEGKYYLWSEAEIDAALIGTFSARFKQVYGVTRDGKSHGPQCAAPAGQPGTGERSRRGAHHPPASDAAGGARQAGAAAARRQAAGRLERAGDRRARQCPAWCSSGPTGSRRRSPPSIMW